MASETTRRWLAVVLGAALSAVVFRVGVILAYQLDEEPMTLVTLGHVVLGYFTGLLKPDRVRAVSMGVALAWCAYGMPDVLRGPLGGFGFMLAALWWVATMAGGGLGWLSSFLLQGPRHDGA